MKGLGDFTLAHHMKIWECLGISVSKIYASILADYDNETIDYIIDEFVVRDEETNDLQLSHGIEKQLSDFLEPVARSRDQV